MAARLVPLGPAMLDVAGLELDPMERERLAHPAVGGVILFSRNYADPRQLAALVAAIHRLREPHLLVAVDHEGGRVQRFREGFTPVPPMRMLGRIWDGRREDARRLAREAGWILAAELRALGVDFSFAPVLDLDHGRSGVIGDRAFHSDPAAVTDLARALIAGMRDAGMAAVGKHFPGHGYAEADSHVAVPEDGRDRMDITMADLAPFRQLAGELAGIMPAHVIYPRVDRLPAGFSPVWLKDILRRELGFDGAIFSDDLSMEGARVAGGVGESAAAAMSAGCDMVLLCNHPEAADELLASLPASASPLSLARLARLHGEPHPLSSQALSASERHRHARRDMVALTEARGDLADA